MTNQGWNGGQGGNWQGGGQQGWGQQGWGQQSPQGGQQQNPWGQPAYAMGQPAGGQPLERLAIRQKIALTVNRYEVLALDAQGNPGQLLAFAEQKRFAFKERVTFFTDATRSQAVFSFRARQVMDLAATYDIFDGAGQPIGWFKKNFGKSLLRSTWHLGDAQGNEYTGQERTMWVAVLRRLMEDSWWLNSFYHFDFTTSDGQKVLHHSRAATFRDSYSVDLPLFHGGQRLDWRLAAAMGVALDALQGR